MDPFFFNVFIPVESVFVSSVFLCLMKVWNPRLFVFVFGYFVWDKLHARIQRGGGDRGSGPPPPPPWNLKILPKR